MLLLLLNWSYIFILSLIFGFSVLHSISEKFDYEIKHVLSYVFAGLSFLTVFSEVFSLFAKVGLVANISILIPALVLLFFFGKKLCSTLKKLWIRTSLTRKIGVLLLIILWLYYSSRGWQHTDTALYHAQAISWIENFGVVKGLGNLHYRIGYNSSVFSLYALFTMRNLFPQTPVYGVNGFFALLVSVQTLSLFDVFRRKKLRISDFTKLFTFYYLATVTDEIFSPASDYPAILCVFFIVNAWLELLEENEKNITPFCLLSVFAVYSATIKVTMALIALIVIKPAIELIKKKRTKEILLYISLGIACFAPWIIRNVILTGYLIYPLEALDIFNVSWKLHPEIVHFDALQIKEWGRGIDGYPLEYMNSFKWVPIWFTTKLSLIEKIFVLTGCISVLIYIILCISFAVKKTIQKNRDFILLEIPIMIGFLYWLFSAPLPRYGYAFLLLPTATILGFIAVSSRFDSISKIVMALIILYKAVMLGKYTVFESGILCDSYVIPSQFDELETLAYEVDGVTFSEFGNSYDSATQSLISRPELGLFGIGIEEGFYYKY